MRSPSNGSINAALFIGFTSKDCGLTRERRRESPAWAAAPPSPSGMHWGQGQIRRRYPKSVGAGGRLPAAKLTALMPARRHPAQGVARGCFDGGLAAGAQIFDTQRPGQFSRRYQDG